MTVQNAIECHGMVKRYGEQRALDSLDLVVPTGSMYGCLGPNGSGKTTAIRVLLDLVRPDAGTVRVLGQDPRQAGAALRRKIGYLPGELGLPDSMTALDALKFYADLAESPGPYREWILDALQLPASMLGRKMRHYSKGMKQKVGIAQAIQHAPELLILDEPTTGLDPVIQARFFSCLQQMRSHGCTVFFSSHILTEVQGICDRVAVLRLGKGIFEGSISRFLEGSDRRLWLKLATASAPPEIEGTVFIGREDDWWVFSAEANQSASVLADVAKLQPIDFRFEAAVEDRFLSLYDGIPPTPQIPEFCDAGYTSR